MGSENSNKNVTENRKTKVSHRVFVSLVVVMSVLIVMFSGISFLTAKVISYSGSYNRMVNEGAIISGIISDHMSSKIAAVRSAAESSIMKNYFASLGAGSSAGDMNWAAGYSDVQAVLDHIVSVDKDVITAWVVSERGGALVADNGRYLPAEEFGLASKYWHQNIVSSKSAVCTDASDSIFDSSQSVISVVYPVCSDSEVIGFVGTEVSVLSLAAMMEQYSAGSGCYPIISGNHGSVIYSSGSENFRKKYDIDSSPLKNIIIQAGSYHNGVDFFSGSYGLGTVYYHVDNVAVAGWNIIVVFDGKVLNGGIYNFLFIEILMLICFELIALIILHSKFRKETVGLSEFLDKVSAVADGTYKRTDVDFTIRNEITDSFAKIDAIANSLNEKNAIIKEYINNDTLTGLPNRMSMYNKLDSLISEGTDKPDKRFALMFVDIDNFKWLNETLGHNFGDAVLSTFSKVLSGALDKVGTVYRFSGDEFIILVEFGNDYEKINNVIHELQNAFSRQIHVLTDNIYLKFSMGVSIFPDDDITADMLMRDADIALHRAKESGKDRVSFFTNREKKQNISKAAIAHQIMTALHGGEMYLNFQPIISTESTDLYGFEVLLRWQNTTLGNISPTEFINVAEESGAIVQIGMWIFEKSCRFIKDLCEKGRDDIVLSINVSGVQLKRDDFIESIKRVIDITQISPENLQLEITESTLVDFIGGDMRVINAINDMGISIAIDDFGTGYSSLNYLKNLPVNCLKIDKSFVDEISSDQKDYKITDSIIDLVHNLGIKTVAEGIETVGQYNFLREMKCDYIQGFLMSKPLDEEAALEFVEMYDALHKPDSDALAEHERQLADEKRSQPEETDKEEKTDTVLVDEFLTK